MTTDDLSREQGPTLPIEELAPDGSRLQKPPSRSLNQLAPVDRAVHDWYRFVLSFPPHLVRQYLQRLDLIPGHCVLDPFAGTGTTLVECQLQGIASVGLEANPMAQFACQTKLDWSPNSDRLKQQSEAIARQARADLTWFPGDSLRHSLPEASEKVLLRNCISPKPLHKALWLLEQIQQAGNTDLQAHQQLALVRAVVASASNLRFAPEASVVRSREDAPVIDLWLETIAAMATDLQSLPNPPAAPAVVYRADARQPQTVLLPASIDGVITSPPYPNEKDYTRNTRLESVLLGFIRNREDLRRVKQSLIRSNSRNIYTADTDDRAIADHPQILALAATIDQRRADLGHTSGFSRLYSKVVKQYFGGMARHLRSLRPLLRPNARLAYVVGDQASYFGVLIPTGALLADLACSLGYEVIDIELFRTRRAASTNQHLREEVVLLRWPGGQ